MKPGRLHSLGRKREHCQQGSLQPFEKELYYYYVQFWRKIKEPRAKHGEPLHNHWQTPWLTRPTAEHLKIVVSMKQCFTGRDELLITLRHKSYLNVFKYDLCLKYTWLEHIKPQIVYG